MRIKSAAFLAVLTFLFPLVLHALPPVSALHGSWGFTILTHNETGTWGSEGGRLVLNANGTGTMDTYFNENGTVSSSLSKPFTYTATVNGNGTITFTMLTPEVSVNQLVINDGQDMMFLDGTRDLSLQKIGVMIRLKETPYNGMDFMGDYNAVAYEYAQGPLISNIEPMPFILTPMVPAARTAHIEPMKMVPWFLSRAFITTTLSRLMDPLS